MIRPINRDTAILSRRSQPAGKEDLTVARDLLDTLKAHSEGCVGMAANMIGINKRIIAIFAGPVPIVMINPIMRSHSAETYETEEGCLSLDGARKTTRYKSIEIEYMDMMMKKQRSTYSGFTAQIIQHEMDHCNGIII